MVSVPILPAARTWPVLLALPPRHHAAEAQTDTYFQVHAGRLKLREIEGQAAQLIWYLRPDTAGGRLSDYQLTAVLDPAALRAMLAGALGLRRVVKKRREIYLWKNVRIHLDVVEGLGSFLELEAVVTAEEDLAASQRHLDMLTDALGIRPGDTIAGSYADLL